MPSSGVWRRTPEDGILHSHRRENLKSYNDKSVLKVIHKQLLQSLDEINPSKPRSSS
jgi:hypothetical protein